jgi:hypothetical protein
MRQSHLLTFLPLDNKTRRDNLLAHLRKITMAIRIGPINNSSRAGCFLIEQLQQEKVTNELNN